MATAQFSELPDFQPEQGRWSVYLERCNMFVAANAITNARKVPLFVICPTIFSFLHDLFQPGDHTTKLYGELVTKLKEHFDHKPVNVLAYRHTFY